MGPRYSEKDLEDARDIKQEMDSRDTNGKDESDDPCFVDDSKQIGE